MLQTIMDLSTRLILKTTRVLNRHSTRYSVLFMKRYFKNKPLIGAEIGVLRGANTLNMLRSLNIKKLYLIDPYLVGSSGSKTLADETFKIAKYTLRKYKDNVVFIKKKSIDAVDDITELLDFVYIDGDHTYTGALYDLIFYYPKIKKGGVICGHDFDIPDVAQAVTEFADNKHLKVVTLGYPVDWWYK